MAGLPGGVPQWRSGFARRLQLRGQRRHRTGFPFSPPSRPGGTMTQAFAPQCPAVSTSGRQVRCRRSARACGIDLPGPSGEGVCLRNAMPYPLARSGVPSTRPAPDPPMAGAITPAGAGAGPSGYALHRLRSNRRARAGSRQCVAFSRPDSPWNILPPPRFALRRMGSRPRLSHPFAEQPPRGASGGTFQ